MVTDDLKESEEDYPGVTAAWAEKVTGIFAEYYTTTENDARFALNDFEYLPKGASGEPFRFQDSWEWQLKGYDWSFLWCCHALKWGIAQYDARPPAATSGEDPEKARLERLLDEANCRIAELTDGEVPAS
jgi:hypothetical protein